MDDNKNNPKDGIYSQRIKAGKRTYFIDVRTTKNNDFYLAITESKRRFDSEGYIKHKIFLYKEDFNKFRDGLNDAINHIQTELMPEYDFNKFDQENEVSINTEFDPEQIKAENENTDSSSDDIAADSDKDSDSSSSKEDKDDFLKF
jgi:hypothetical protein